MHLLSLLACSEYSLEGKPDATGTSDTTDTYETETETDSYPTEDLDCPADPLPGYPGSSDGTCASEIVVGTFDPVIEWEWTTSAAFTSYVQVMTTPVVGNLTDDDGDGDIDTDDVPDIVFTAFAETGWNREGTLVSLSGDTGAVNFELGSAGGYSFQGTAGAALGDLEGDGSPDICVPGYAVALVCLEADGSFKWAAGSETATYGFPAIADLDGDGSAEVILGRQIFDASGNLLGLGAYGVGTPPAWWDGNGTAMSFAANMDADAELEVVAGNTVYEMDGTLLWSDGGSDGFAAVADLDADGAPEVVKVVDGTVYVTDTDGTPIRSVSPGYGGDGGPPTIADFDGDGAPEIGVAGAYYYMVLEADGTVLWQAPVSDATSNVTGSAVFDFEGDGVAEVVYADEHTVWVFDGVTGAVEMELTGHASATAFEYPVIADVDRDGSAEIVFGSNNSYFAGSNGLRVIGDSTSSWRPGRPAWNQHAYSITNVEDDLSIPAVQVDNWASHNNFRSGDAATGFGTSLPDLVLVQGDVCEVDCDEGRLVVWIHPGNQGAVEAEGGAIVTLYAEQGGVQSRVGSASVGLLPAGQIAASLVFDVTVTGTVDRLHAVITPAGSECVDTNDTLVVEGPFCE